jgi:hypothetical protein
MKQARLARLVSLLVLTAPALSACGSSEPPMWVMPATVSASPEAASTIMSCDTIETEHAAIVQSLKQLNDSSAADDLRRRDAGLAELAAQKGCRPF